MTAWQRNHALLFLLALASSIATLRFYYVGEEAILTISSLEMWYRSDWLRLWMYGGDAQHGVFANWLVIPLASLIGMENVLPAARAVMVAATAGTGGLTYWLLRRLGQERAIAGLAAVLYLTSADILLYRGWLAYRDPLFGFLVFASIALLWIAAHERRVRWIVVSGLCAFAAYLTKGLTAYIFLGSAALVLVLRRDLRSFLLGPQALLTVLGGLALPVLWLYVVQSGTTQAVRFTSEIGAKLVAPSMTDWAIKLAAYPVETFLRLLPSSALALWLVVRSGRIRTAVRSDPIAMTAAWMALLGFLPYWLAPHSHFRYLLPIVPLVIVACTMLIGRSGEQALRWCYRLTWVLIAVKLVMVTVGFPYYQERYRGANYAAAARAIIEKTHGFSLYTINVSASGLSVSAYIDQMRLPAAPLVRPVEPWTDGFVIAYEPDPAVGRAAATYKLAGNELYLLCRGAACDAAAAAR